MRNKKSKTGFFSKIQYLIDSTMTKGMKSMMLILFVAAAILSVLFGTFVGLTTGEATVMSGIWDSIMHIIDPGTITGDTDKSLMYMVVMSIATVCGLVIISTLIGIINTSITLKLEKIRKGKSKIIENDHIVILGFDEEIYKIIEELIISNRDETRKKKSIVILDAEKSPEEMDDAISKRIPNRYNTRIICRKGNIYDVDAIDMCSVNTCRSVIVNVESDFVTIKCILAVASVLKENDNVHITAVIKDSDYHQAAMIASNNRVLLLNFEEIIAKIIAQSGSHTGASHVFTELFGFKGSEFYTIPADEKLVGKKISEVNLYCDNAVFVGKEVKKGKNSRTYLYPSIPEEEQIVNEDDNLIFISSDSHIHYSDTPYLRENNVELEYKEDVERAVTSTLILRYSKKIETILAEHAKLSDKKSKVTVAVNPEDVEKVRLLKEAYGYENLEIIENFEFSSKRLKRLIERIRPQSVIVLASTTDNRNDFEMSDMKRKRLMYREDSEIILLLLQLKSLVNKTDLDFSITSEIQYSENQNLVSKTGINDFVVGSVVTNQILAQVARQKNRLNIFQDIITAGGSDIVFRSATEFMKVGSKIKIYDIYSVASERESDIVFIGYKKDKADENGEFVFINPEKTTDYVCEENDLFVFIGKE